MHENDAEMKKNATATPDDVNVVSFNLWGFQLVLEHAAELYALQPKTVVADNSWQRLLKRQVDN